MAKYKPLEIKPEDLAKVEKNRRDREAIQIDENQLFIAEFGKHFGWGGVEAILNNEIDMQTAVWLMNGARKVDHRYTLNTAQAVFVGSGSVNSKKPKQAFERATKDLKKATKADQ